MGKESRNSSNKKKKSVLSQKLLPDNSKFDHPVSVLRSVLGEKFSERELLTALRSCRGDVEFALNKLLSEDVCSKIERSCSSTSLSSLSEMSESFSEGPHSLLHGISQELICAICCDLYSEPVSLPCQHVFCRSCIQSLLAYQPQCICPTCRQPAFPNSSLHDVQENLKNLRAERALSQIVSHFQQSKINVDALPSQNRRRNRLSKYVDVSVVSFSVTIEEAKIAFWSWVQRLWFVPPDFAESLQIKEFRQVWIPFYLIETRAPRRFGFQTRWEKETFMEEAGFFPEMDLSPSFSYCNETLQPFSKEDLKIDVREFSVPLDRAWNKVRKRITMELESRKIPYDNTKLILHRSTKIFLPAFVGIFEFKLRDYRFIISGTKAEVFSERPSFLSFL